MTQLEEVGACRFPVRTGTRFGQVVTTPCGSISRTAAATAGL